MPTIIAATSRTERWRCRRRVSSAGKRRNRTSRRSSPTASASGSTSPICEQVSVRSQSSEEAHSPLTVLTDLSQLDTQFTASESGERDGLVWLKLVSKAKEPEFEYAELGFSRQHARPHAVQGPARQHDRNTILRLEAESIAFRRYIQVHAAEGRRRDRQHWMRVPKFFRSRIDAHRASSAAKPALSACIGD